MARREFDEILRAVRTVKSNRPEESKVAAGTIARRTKVSDLKETREQICQAEVLSPARLSSHSDSRDSTRGTGLELDGEEVTSKQKSDIVTGIHDRTNGASKCSISPIKNGTDFPTICLDLISTKYSG